MSRQKKYFNTPMTLGRAQQIIDNRADAANGRKPLMGDEMRVLEYLAAMDSKIIESGEAMRERLREIPNGWRQWRLMASTLNRLLVQLYGIIPIKNLRHIQNICAHGEVLIRMRPATRVPEYTLINEDDIREVANVAMSAECTICMKQSKEIDRCRLRQAMLNIAQPYVEPPFSCGYQIVALAAVNDEKKQEEAKK